MPPSLSELKVTPSFCVAFKIPDNVAASNTHTTYSRNNIGQKCEGNCGLWVLNEMLKERNPENLKKIVGAVWELPALAK